MQSDWLSTNSWKKENIQKSIPKTHITRRQIQSRRIAHSEKDIIQSMETAKQI